MNCTQRLGELPKQMGTENISKETFLLGPSITRKFQAIDDDDDDDDDDGLFLWYGWPTKDY